MRVPTGSVGRPGGAFMFHSFVGLAGKATGDRINLSGDDFLNDVIKFCKYKMIGSVSPKFINYSF